MAVNVSFRQFHQADLAQRILATLEQEGVPPSCFSVELTEGVIMTGVNDTVAKMRALRALGVDVSIDDFRRRRDQVEPENEVAAERSVAGRICVGIIRPITVE